MTDPTPPKDGDVKSTDKMVWCTCKHPPGLILKIWEREDHDVSVLGGGLKTEGRSVAVGDPVRIFGPAVPFGREARCRIVKGYALTPNVPGDFAREWLKQNAKSDLVKNKLVMFHDSEQKAVAWAKEMGGDVRSGLEQLNPEMNRKIVAGKEIITPADIRWPVRANPNLTILQSDTREG